MNSLFLFSTLLLLVHITYVTPKKTTARKLLQEGAALFGIEDKLKEEAAGALDVTKIDIVGTILDTDGGDDDDGDDDSGGGLLGGILGTSNDDEESERESEQSERDSERSSEASDRSESDDDTSFEWWMAAIPIGIALLVIILVLCCLFQTAKLCCGRKKKPVHNHYYGQPPGGGGYQQVYGNPYVSYAAPPAEPVSIRGGSLAPDVTEYSQNPYSGYGYNDAAFSTNNQMPF